MMRVMARVMARAASVRVDLMSHQPHDLGDTKQPQYKMLGHCEKWLAGDTEL
jgi:hypothetical protein